MDQNGPNFTPVANMSQTLSLTHAQTAVQNAATQLQLTF